MSAARTRGTSRRRGARQTLIPGTAADVIAELETGAANVKDLKDAAKQASDAVKKAMETLGEAMVARKLSLYKCRETDLTIEVDAETKVKVKGKKKANSEEEHGGDDPDDMH